MNEDTQQTTVIPAVEVMEGGGVNVFRTIGTPALRRFDPFMLLDHMSSDDPDEYIAGFPPHPHRGFNTFTYMIDGDMEHKDSMGNTGNLGPGGAQWMKAASGVIHSEMPKQQNGLLRGFQLWINLPAANKFDAPEYQEYASDAFPLIEEEGSRVKLVIGDYADERSPIRDVITDVTYLDVQLEQGKHFKHVLSQAYNSFIYVFEGAGTLGEKPVMQHSLATVDGEIDFTASAEGVRFILVSGKPIKEAVAQYGPFVMNTREEIDEAMRDFQSNNFVRERAWIKNRKKMEV